MNTYKRNIYLFYAYKFFADFVFFSSVLVVFYTDWGGISQFHVQILQAWFTLWILLLEVPTGMIADYFGRKFSLILGGVVGALGFSIYTIKPHFGIFLFAEFLIAMSLALTSGADEAFVYDSLKKVHTNNISAYAKKMFANVQIMQMAGMSFAAIVGGFIASSFGLVYPMRFTVLSFLCAAIIAFFFAEPKTQKKAETMRYVHLFTRGARYFAHNKV